MKKILCFGDSNTYGYIPQTGGRYGAGERWTGILAERLFSYGYKIIEGGLNGRTTVFDDERSADRNGSNAILPLLKENDPVDIVLIMLGTNDCKTKFAADADMITAGMGVLISMIRAFSPDTRIFIIVPAEITGSVLYEDGDFDRDSIEKSCLLKDKYAALARERDCGCLCAGDIVKADPSDGVHLSAASHRLLAEELFRVIISE